jgi:pantoate--beta-alanine ligase
VTISRTIAEVREYLRAQRGSPGPAPSQRGIKRVEGLVPTMGALHEGHVALFRTARRACAHVVASIFVNPGQFNDPADLAAYPRQETRDVEVARAAGIDAIFAPSVEEMYPAGDGTSLLVQGAALGFEGDFRPGHFNSVATVCLKLFNIVMPDIAFFGQKDAQQVAVIRQIVRDLRLDVKISVVPTVREADGLALSSRNVRLSAADRLRALAIPRALTAGVTAHVAGADPAQAARRELEGLDVDYADVAVFDGEPTLVIAARAGPTRLIDNVPLNHPERAGLARGIGELAGW